MHSKKEGLFFSHIIAILAIVTTLFFIDLFLSTLLPNPYLRLPLLLLLATLFYAFLAPSIIEPFLQTDEKLKEMIDQTLHELNTPIATIEANLTLLERSIKDQKSQKRLQRIKAASKNLTKLYESIEYDIKEKIEAIEESHFGLHEAIDETILRFEELKKDITITNTAKDLLLYTDYNGFSRILDNLLSNAIKYNRKDGFVKFYTKEYRLYIEDSGIGIDPKNLFIIYEKSFQENPTTLGFGLGMSIVKNFCDRYKIDIKIDTQKNKGTTIILDLKPIIYK